MNDSSSGGWATITTTSGDTTYMYDYTTLDYKPIEVTGGWKQADWEKQLKEFDEAHKKADALTKKQKEKIMGVFEVIVVDKKECEILHKQHVVAKDKETAMLELDLTPEIRKKVKKNLIEFIFTDLGSFTRVEKKIVVREVEDGNDED